MQSQVVDRDDTSEEELRMKADHTLILPTYNNTLYLLRYLLILSHFSSNFSHSFSSFSILSHLSLIQRIPASILASHDEPKPKISQKCMR